MHGHANTYMASGNYQWLGKGKIQNVQLLELFFFKCEFSRSHCSKPTKKKKNVLNMTTLLGIMKAKVE